jgi:hypothetical protein
MGCLAEGASGIGSDLQTRDVMMGIMHPTGLVDVKVGAISEVWGPVSDSSFAESYVQGGRLQESRPSDAPTIHCRFERLPFVVGERGPSERDS